MNRTFKKNIILVMWLFALGTFVSCTNSKTNRSLPSHTYEGVYFCPHAIEDYDVLCSDKCFALMFHNDSIGNYHICVGFSKENDTLNYQNKTVFIETDSKSESPNLVVFRDNIVFIEKNPDTYEYIVKDLNKTNRMYKTTEMSVNQNSGLCEDCTENIELKNHFKNITVSIAILENLCMIDGNNWQNAIQILQHIYDINGTTITTIDNIPNNTSHLIQKILQREKIMSQYIIFRKKDIK